MKRLRVVLLSIMVLLFMANSQVVYARALDDWNGTNDAYMNPNSPSSYNIPVAPTTWSFTEIPEVASETWERLTDDQGFLANNITDLFIKIVNGMFKFFGLYSVDQLAMNTTKDFWGALSLQEWTNVVKPFVIAFTTIAWMVAGISIQLFTIKLAASTMNARRRASVIEYFQNWFIGAVFLAIGPAAINMIFQAASAMIIALKATIGDRPFNPVTDMFTPELNDSLLGLGTPIAFVIYLLVVTGVTFMLNFIYLQRYVTLFVYAILCPIFMTFYFFDNTRNLFWNWIKEIIGLAFMPVIHMLLIAIYMMISAGTTSYMLRLVFLVMFIPMSEMVRKLTSTAGGTGGVAENLLGGMGMGLAMQGVRTLSGAGGAMFGGGMAESMLYGMGATGGAAGASGGGSNSGPSSAGGGSSGSAGFLGQRPISGGVGVEEMMSTVNTARGFGSKSGGVAGAIAGGLMGAGTGNMGGIMMGALVGQRSGGKLGGKIAGRTVGQKLVNNAMYPSLDENGMDPYEGLTTEERQERAFGPGADAPSKMPQDMRQTIASRNIAMVKGQGTKAASYNAQINSDLAGMRDSAHSLVNEGDKLVSIGYGDHTDYYRSNADEDTEWLYSSQQGDKRAGGGKAVRSEFEVGQNRAFRETSRSMVNTGDIKGNTGLPQGWNT